MEEEKSERVPIMIFTRPDSQEVKVCLKKKWEKEKEKSDPELQFSAH